MPSPKSIEVVVKVTERCNINCTYCYVFNKGDESFARHPKHIPETVVRDLARFLSQAASSAQTTRVKIDFHGGEPLMMNKQRFRLMCDILIEQISPYSQIQFSLQTNGMLVDDEWVEIFRTYQISIGVSIDGPESINDRARMDHKGRGTYSRTVAGWNKLLCAWNEGLIPSLGVLTVIDTQHNSREIYRHFVDDLGVQCMDFLLPIDYHDDTNEEANSRVGRYLCDAFDEWAKDNDPFIYIRIFARTVQFFRDGPDAASRLRKARKEGNVIITVASNGDIGPDDSLRTLNLGLFDAFNVGTSTFDNFRSSDKQIAISSAENTLPDQCIECSWMNICRGGAANGRLLNRFSRANGFNNPSIVCGALKEFYAHAAAYMLRNGLPYELLRNTLINESTNWDQYAEPCQFSADGRFLKESNSTNSLHGQFA